MRRAVLRIAFDQVVRAEVAGGVDILEAAMVEGGQVIVHISVDASWKSRPRLP
jgi:hypothetical protein